jgi:hypothetical protein
MSFQDKTIRCVDCGQGFTFTAREQRFYSSHGLQNEPKRCPRCRKGARPQRRGPRASWASYASRAMLGGEYHQGV